jgi:hypothetical protein
MPEERAGSKSYLVEALAFVAGGVAAVVVGVGRVAGGKRGAAARHSEDIGMASG